MLPQMISGEPAGGSVRMTGDRGGTNVPGNTEGKSTVYGQWRGNVSGVTVSALSNPELCGCGREKAMGEPPLPYRDP